MVEPGLRYAQLRATCTEETVQDMPKTLRFEKLCAECNQEAVQDMARPAPREAVREAQGKGHPRHGKGYAFAADASESAVFKAVSISPWLNDQSCLANSASEAFAWRACTGAATGTNIRASRAPLGAVLVGDSSGEVAQ
mmetsp:Transcript_175199/g.561882  ORF Transcript_175199/g.561882 Transcript_175199/m.561882 type:complete len:139 (+) Transcript_175199:252-668(+)